MRDRAWQAARGAAGTGLGGRCRVSASVRGLGVIVLAMGVLGFVVPAAGAATFNWYWPSGPSENCWQTGQLGAGSQACDNTGALFLGVPGRMFDDTSGGISKDVQLSPSGDYCSSYVGDALNKRDATNESAVTGFGTPSPWENYQEWDGNGNVCQANGPGFGQKVQGASCARTCGMHHYASFYEQGYSDRPWSTSFGSPSLVLSAQATVQTLAGASVGAWGYVCPILQDTVAPHNILEYCLQEWRGPGNEKAWEAEKIGSCANGPSSNAIDTVNTFFYPGTQLATQLSGSANTEVAKAGWRTYTARITETNLRNTIELDRRPYLKKPGSRESNPELGYGCGRSAELSTDPKNYALIGVEQGAEGWSFSEIGAAGTEIRLSTEYTPLPPEATTNEASGLRFKRAALNGTVNPKGTDTHYYFQYGKTTAYGSSTASTDAGSGTSSVAEAAAVTGLEPGTTYHYRIVATSAGGTVQGSDQAFTTAAPPVITLARPTQASMTLSWTTSANALSYTVVRNGVAVETTTSSTFTDNKLHAATFYRYEVVANEESESAGSTTITRATTPLSTLAADVNADGKTDLTYLYPGGYIDSFLSLGTGTYEEKQAQIEENFDVAGGLWLAGNVTGTGRSALIYIYPGGYIEAFLSNGNGTYERKVQEVPGFNSTGGTWEVGDFNGDGKTDLVYIYGKYIDTFLSKGDGTYEEKQEEVNSNFNSVEGTWEVGDFNGDGKADLAYVVKNYIDTFLSKGNGTYEEKQEEVNSNFNSVEGTWEVGDFNGDGKADLAYVVKNYIDTFLSKGNGTYEEKQEEVNSNFNSTEGQWRTGDANHDGKADLSYVVKNYIDTFLSKGNGTYEEKQEEVNSSFNSTAGIWL
jgi:hypothetical protein